MKHPSIEAQMANSQQAVLNMAKLFPGQVELRFNAGQTASQTEVVARITGPRDTVMEVSIPQANRILRACTDC